MRNVSELRDVLIVDAVRTPVGRGHPEKGALKDVHPADLLGQTFVALLDRAGVDSVEVDNVIAGCVYQIAEQSTGITRSRLAAKGSFRDGRRDHRRHPLWLWAAGRAPRRAAGRGRHR